MTRSKYNIRTDRIGKDARTVDGILFASKAEAKRYGELKLLERSGEISRLETQPVFEFTIDGRPVLIRSEGYPNGRCAKYRADFRYFDHRKKAIVVEDKKGTKTEAYKLRKALVECLWPGTVIVEV